MTHQADVIHAQECCICHHPILTGDSRYTANPRGPCHYDCFVGQERAKEEWMGHYFVTIGRELDDTGPGWQALIKLRMLVKPR